MLQRLQQKMEAMWYADDPLVLLLLPLAWLYRLCIALRRFAYSCGLMAINKMSVPVIVVGNITVGGTGKTPLVIWLAAYFKQQGFHPGIISRGYRGHREHAMQQVFADSDPATVGDEAVLIAQQTNCPVAVASARHQAAAHLINHCDCNLIVADDGLQHYALARDVEIAVIDGMRRFGNQHCLPAGPLREPPWRLQQADLVVSKHQARQHEFKMDYVYGDLISLANKRAATMPLAALVGKKIHAIAGLSNPQHFFDYLREQQLEVIAHKFPDHYLYKAEDINFNDNLLIVLTEKDAVKCTAFATAQHWVLPIMATLPKSFEYRLDLLMKEIADGQKAA